MAGQVPLDADPTAYACLWQRRLFEEPTMLNGLRISATGCLTKVSTTALGLRIRENNGIVDERVTKKTDLLVSAQNPFLASAMSTQLQKALANGTPVIPWEEFANVLDGKRQLSTAIDYARQRSGSLAAHFGIAMNTEGNRSISRAGAVAAQLNVLANTTHARSRIGF